MKSWCEKPPFFFLNWTTMNLIQSIKIFLLVKAVKQPKVHSVFGRCLDTVAIIIAGFTERCSTTIPGEASSVRGSVSYGQVGRPIIGWLPSGKLTTLENHQILYRKLTFQTLSYTICQGRTVNLLDGWYWKSTNQSLVPAVFWSIPIYAPWSSHMGLYFWVISPTIQEYIMGISWVYNQWYIRMLQVLSYNQQEWDI